jgi:hypothetical protein
LQGHEGGDLTIVLALLSCWSLYSLIVLALLWGQIDLARWIFFWSKLNRAEWLNVNCFDGISHLMGHIVCAGHFRREGGEGGGVRPHCGVTMLSCHWGVSQVPSFYCSTVVTVCGVSGWMHLLFVHLHFVIRLLEVQKRHC